MKNLKTFKQLFENENSSDLSEKDKEWFWIVVEKLKWNSDNDYKRINDYLIDNYSDKEIKKLHEIYYYFREQLHEKYEKDWLADPGIEVSDDGWDDLRSEIIGRGKKFYESISVRKMQLMALNNDYHENFGYSFQID